MSADGDGRYFWGLALCVGMMPPICTHAADNRKPLPTLVGNKPAQRLMLVLMTINIDIGNSQPSNSILR